MATFSIIKNIIKTQWLDGGPQDVFMVQSEPGIGKSAMGKELGSDEELAFDNVVEINGSLLDTPDLAGLALIGDTSSEFLKFKHSPLIAPLTSGRNLIQWEEVPDSNLAMQNLIARWAYDRNVNGLALSNDTYHLMLGNRSKDKSGAGRVSSKLSNRVCVMEMDADLDSWVQWALDNNVDPVGIQFLRYRPALFSKFDPDAAMGINPTPRSWVRAFRTSKRLDDGSYFTKVSGEVGEGNAAEYTAFRKIYLSLVSFEEVVMNPTTTPVPKDLSAQYAIVGSLAHQTTVPTIERVAKYIERMSPDFGVMFWQDTMKKTPAVRTTKPFLAWASSSANILMS